MKLTPPVWRTAWYEDGLSERFAQEMSRLEKAALKDLNTSAEWVEQLVIELGQLTQNMIHLEGEQPRPHQLRLAFERALKLAALSAHLMAALDHALQRGPSVLRYSEAAVEPGFLPPLPPRLSPTPGAWAAPGPALAAAPAAAPLPAQPTPQLHLRASVQTQLGLKRQALGEGERPAAVERAAPPGAPALVNNLMEISQPMIEASPSPMREMILALSRRGLSRAEIEVITEQPRHIIEAVLQHGG
jgi:hypothetical protein